ncbi:hypothetical protein DFH07DRAFT_867895 [Mycena maculata]|uniref:CxC2-like cysteine cluster KDZ transposase-associated domain-containing protein n=1 Tax=Mycena maculata TaxID=230809 RepID=A0AAD7J9K2_9AGAR|nr:hypothetical protein DFH07DRAFT_867895 [Mycena maculata]
MLRLEGRGDHAVYPMCPRCGKIDGEYRCKTCLGGGELLCSGCITEVHGQLPFHKIERWTGDAFERISLMSLGLHIQLGHWYGPQRACPVPEPAADDDFVIIDVHGVHWVHLDYCGCGRGGLRTVQLLRAGLWAATMTNPKTAATFAVLEHWHMMSFETKCSVLHFYEALARESDNLNAKRDKDRYHEFLLMTKEWRHYRMGKRGGRGHDPGGFANTKPGECALLCPACPHPGKNLPPEWEMAPDDKQFLYALFLAMDANFRLKRKDVSTEEKDPGLGKGWAFFLRGREKHWKQKQDRSHCVAHDAVDKPDREVRGTASSGVGTVDCARHNMKRPNAVGDLQLGERYVNMDYMFFSSIAGSPLRRFCVSYDIACQWHIKIWKRMVDYKDESLMVEGRAFMTFLVPKFHLPAHIEECNLKFSFNLTPEVGRTNGEAAERGWADTNPLAGQTKEMGPGARRDTIDDHWNDRNWKKIIALAYTMRRKVETAVPEMVRTRQALADLESSLEVGVVEEWTKMAKAWEADVRALNPFETQRKDQHLAKVRMEMAREAANAASLAAARKEKEGEVQGDMHIMELLGMGLQLEDQQYVARESRLHPTDGQRRAMLERTSKLRRKIVAWIELQTRFFPGLKNVRELEDEERASIAETRPIAGVDVSAIKLWPPSAIAATSEAKDVPVATEILVLEYRLRVAQAHEALHEVRRLLLVRTYTYKGKDTRSRGVAANTRAGHKIAALNNQIERGAAQYRVGRAALVTLGGVLKRTEWEWTLLELKEDDVRGLPRATFSDPERRKKNQNKMVKLQVPECPLSWIWINRGEKWEPGDTAALNEAVRIEWAKTRARAMRWREEVDLLEEEMRRIVVFHMWRGDWWRTKVGRKILEPGPQWEGETAYALRQAAVQTTLAKRCATEWEAGQLVGEATAESDDEDGGGGVSEQEEEEAIPTLPQREVKSTYVDEVLAM